MEYFNFKRENEFNYSIASAITAAKQLLEEMKHWIHIWTSTSESSWSFV